ncbi:MAG TPA: trypsin-like peptidase domain-containing protein [Allosphingosinicella sp.]|jgi:hypothetical protein
MATDREIEALAKLVTANDETFGAIFLHAQEERDSSIDLPTVGALAGATDTSGRVAACLRYASDNGFLRVLLRTAIEQNAAGPPLESNAKAFAALATNLTGIKPRDLANAQTAFFEAQALMPGSYTADPKRLISQISATMRQTCRILDRENQVTGTGVLIAPHLVLTAAHVLDRQIGNDGKELPGSAERIEVRLDVLGDTSAEAPRVPLVESWLVDRSPCPECMLTGRAGEFGSMPSADALLKNDDYIIIELAAAPGFTRGWVDVSRGDEQIESDRRGLVFHHHPGGADQKISFGQYREAYGPRFLHDCDAVRGSSGGPILDLKPRFAGVHHGTMVNGEDVKNVAGAGASLAAWAKKNRERLSPGAALNPIWEIRPSGSTGTGKPVLGLEPLQRQIWDMQRADKAQALVLTGPHAAAQLLFDVVAMMLPRDQATIIPMDRSKLNLIQQRAAGETESGATAVAVAGLIEHITQVVTPESSTASTDSIGALKTAEGLSAALEALCSHGRIWVLVNVSSTDMSTPLSEALAHLYRATLSLPDGRGRLLVTGRETFLGAGLRELVEDSFTGEIREGELPMPTAGDIARHLAKARLARQLAPEDSGPKIAHMIIEIAKLRASAGADMYGEILRQVEEAIG